MKEDIERIKQMLGPEGVKVYGLLLEFADEDGQIHFDGSEEDMLKEIQRLYLVRFGGEESSG